MQQSGVDVYCPALALVWTNHHALALAWTVNVNAACWIARELLANLFFDASLIPNIPV